MVNKYVKKKVVLLVIIEMENNELLILGYQMEED